MKQWTCPICKKAVKLGDPDFPFCGERCRLVDLGNWSSEKYVISSPANPQIDREDVEDE
jgi:endogenous inhibitor of DNA gyrase (YacG/DUF329 family)